MSATDSDHRGKQQYLFASPTLDVRVLCFPAKPHGMAAGSRPFRSSIMADVNHQFLQQTSREEAACARGLGRILLKHPSYRTLQKVPPEP